MSKKFLLKAIAAALLLVAPTVTWAAGSNPTDVTVSGTVDPFAEWAASSENLTIGTHISAMGTAQMASIPLTLYTNVTVTIIPTDGVNGGTLKSAGGGTLTTSYALTTGAIYSAAISDLSDADGVGNAAAFTLAGPFRAAASFIGHTYNLVHVDGLNGVTGGAVTFNMIAKVQAPAGYAPDSGAYSTVVRLTAAW